MKLELHKISIDLEIQFTKNDKGNLMVSAFKAKHKYGNINVKLPSMPGWLSKLMKVKKKIRVSVQYAHHSALKLHVIFHFVNI